MLPTFGLERREDEDFVKAKTIFQTGAQSGADMGWSRRLAFAGNIALAALFIGP